MTNKLLTTDEMLADLSTRIRIASYTAIDCANHLALRSERQMRAMGEVANGLFGLADAVRSIRESQSAPSAK